MRPHDRDLKLELLARFSKEKREQDLQFFLADLRDDLFERLSKKRRKAEQEFLEDFWEWLKWKEKQALAQAEHDRETLFLLLLWLFFVIVRRDDHLKKSIETIRLQDKDRHHFFDRHETLNRLIEAAATAAGYDFVDIHHAVTTARLVDANGNLHPPHINPSPRLAALAARRDESESQSSDDLAEAPPDFNNRPQHKE